MKPSLAIAATAAAAVIVAAVSASRLAAASSPAAPAKQFEPVLWGHIKSLNRKGHRFEMRFDPALWLTGVTAERACGCKPVANDYYVVDETHRLLTYVVLPSARVTVLTRALRPTSIPVSELVQIVKGKNPRHRSLFDRRNALGYWLRIGHRYPNPVISLDQQYQP